MMAMVSYVHGATSISPIMVGRRAMEIHTNTTGRPIHLVVRDSVDLQSPWSGPYEKDFLSLSERRIESDVV